MPINNMKSFVDNQFPCNEFAKELLFSLNSSATDNEIIFADDQWILVGQYLESIQKIRVNLLSYAIETPSTLAIIGHKSVENLALMVAAWSLNYSLLILPTRASAEFQAQLITDADAFLVEVDLQHNVTVKLSGNTNSDCELTALWLPTSGTTGNPKLVKLTIQSMLNFVHWAKTILPNAASCRVLSYAPLNFDLSLLEIWAPIIAGGKVVIANERKMTHGVYLRKLIEQQQINVLQGVSGLYRTLLQANTSPLNNVNLAIVTGEKFPLPLVHQITEFLPDCQVMNVYGSTETNNSFAATVDKTQITMMKSLPMGQSLPGVNFSIDFANGLDKGELLVHTPFMSAGYSDKHKTTEKFFTDEHGKYWFRTGDLVSVDENGELKLDGRIDHQIKIDGVRINLSDIEMVLLRHPEIRVAAVWTRLNEQGEYRVIAAINTTTSIKLSPLSLRKYCAEHLLTAAIPKQLLFTSEEFPISNNGKYDMAKLALLYGG